MRKRFQELQYQLAAHLRDPDRNPAPPGADDARCGVYRRLFFNNIMGFTGNAFPVLAGVLGEERWRALNREFYARHRCHSPYFMDISAEFARFLARYEPAADDPPFMSELAHYEWLEMALGTDDDAPDWRRVDARGDLLAGAPVLSPLVRQRRYRWPVHRIRPDAVPEEEAPAYLLVWRDSGDEVRFMECNPVSAMLLAGLADAPRKTGAEHIRAVLEAQGLEATPEAMSGGAEMLDDLRRKDIVLGTRRE